jgi:hypothetical protein
MDSNRTAEDFFQAHPDWFARQASGDPYRNQDKYIACVNSAYYDEYLPSVLAEIVERSHPEGFTDNSWSGMGRNSICYCDNCARKFRDRAGQPLPRARNWDDPVYRQWIEWNYARRIEIWDLNNRATRAAGGQHCLWIGMNSGSIGSQSRSFRDFAEICKRSEMVLLDHQARDQETGFQQNADAGKLVHGLLGWDKLIPESMAMYRNGSGMFRMAAQPAPEARMWMLEGIAGGIQLWWHHVGAFQEDRRQFHTAEPIFRWHQEHERYLVDRRPVASVGLVWSQRNTDYYGREESAELVDLPHRGWAEALRRARIPYLPLQVDQIDGAEGLSVLVLPDLGALSDAQCAAIRRFSERGGGVVASGPTSLYNEWGDGRPDFALAGLFGAHAPAGGFARGNTARTAHSYLRIAEGPRHPVLAGFDETDIMAFGGALTPLRTDPGVAVPLTFIPPFPTLPPETAWMRQPKTEIPGLVLRTAGDSRVAYMPADLDRRFSRENLPDHGALLANIVRWAAAGRIPLEVSGAGFIDCHLYRQPGRLILHLVNLTNAAAWRAPMTDFIAVGPLQVRVQLPPDVRGGRAQCLVSAAKPSLELRRPWAAFELKSVVDHEVVVVE